MSNARSVRFEGDAHYALFRQLLKADRVIRDVFGIVRSMSDTA